MAESFDVIVVGAGIVGAACACEFALAGLRVLLCEASEYCGGGATAAGMGHIAVMDDSEAQFALTAYSQQLWRELALELPKSAEYWNCGSLWVAADEEELGEVHRKYQYYSERGIPVEMIDANQLAEAEPALRAGLAGALRMPNDSVCYPPAAARYLVERMKAAGGQIRYSAQVISVSDTGVRLAGSTHLHAGIIVVANGVAASRLTSDIDVKPRKGHLAITDRYPGMMRHQLIELGYLKSAHTLRSDSVAFNAQPRRTGQVLIGSSRQYGVEDTRIDDVVLSRMLARAVEYLPRLASAAVIRTWTGFRAATPDKLPLIGLAAGFERVYLSTGHEGLGISTSLATARLLADKVLGRASEIDPEPYEPSRSFAVHA